MKKSNSHSFISFRKSWEISSDSWFLLGQCKALIRAISGTPLMPTYRKKIYSVSLVKGAMATTAIEGNTLTEEEIQLILEGNSSIPPSKEYMEIEVKNILDALNVLSRKLLIEGESQIITPELIREFHSMIGKNLGEHFQAVPGQFRKNNVTVGNVYRAPDSSEIPELMKNFCEWSRKEFHYQQGQNFSTAIIQAIVSHVYIAWIHPFGDGNGRTARLLEFYLLLRAGVPDIASHILSNFYNNTRAEYFRKLAETSKLNGNLTNFINYALQGFKDGLQEVFNLVNQNQLELAWRNYVNERFRTSSLSVNKIVSERQLSLALSMKIGQEYSLPEILEINDSIRIQYSNKSKRTLSRDIDSLLSMEVIQKLPNEKYLANSNVLIVNMPASVKDKTIL